METLGDSNSQKAPFINPSGGHTGVITPFLTLTYKLIFFTCSIFDCKATVKNVRYRGIVMVGNLIGW